MYSLFNQDGHILVQDSNGNYGYVFGIVGPPEDNNGILIRNDDHAINWVIGVDPNPKRVSSQFQMPEAIEMQIACTAIYPEGALTIAPGYDGPGDRGLRGYSLKSKEAKDYIEKKYGKWGLKRLQTCLRTGERF